MSTNYDAIKKQCMAALCHECNGRGSLPDRPGYAVLCVCADGLSEAGEDMPAGRFVRNLLDAVAEVERLQAELKVERKSEAQALREAADEAWCETCCDPDAVRAWLRTRANDIEKEAPVQAREAGATRAALDAILEIVTPENDPPDEDLTIDGIVESVRRLSVYAAETTAALNAERDACDEARSLIVRGAFTMASIPHSSALADWMSAHDARRAAEAKEQQL